MLRNLDTIYYIARSSKNFSTEINFSENIFLVYSGSSTEAVPSCYPSQQTCSWLVHH